MEIYDRRDDPFDEANIEIDTLLSQKSEIQQFYENKTILITGGSGFLGILLIEKLLRSCSNLNKLVLLLREKKGKSISSRIEEMFRDEVFDRMKQENPNYANQVEIVNGCCEKPNLGLEEAQITKLQSEVDIMFHSAASVRFDEPIRKIYQVNVAGVKTLLEIAKGVRNLKAFVYVSTAYAQSHLSKIEEKFYSGAVPDEELNIFLNNFDDKTLTILTPKILNGRHNTYTFTKGMAEELVGKHKSTLPIAVFRPTIVTPTFKDPRTCWTNNIYGATGIFFGSAIGFLRTIYCDPNCKAEIIPADRVVNALIVVPKHIQTYWYSLSSRNRLNVEPVYNFAMQQNDRGHLTWGSLMNLLESLTLRQNLVSDKVLWVYHLSLDRHKFIWLLKYFMLQLLPAPFFVLMEKMSKQRPRLWKGYVKMYAYMSLYSFFMTQSWTICQENSVRLFADLNPTDKILFNCDVNVDWTRYFYYMTKGIGRYLLRCDWNGIQNRAKIKIIHIIDQTLVWTFRGLVLFLFTKIMAVFVQRVFLWLYEQI